MKVEAMRQLGAEVVLYGSDFDEARLRAEELARQEGYRYVHPVNEPFLIAGVATAIASGGPGAVFWMWVTAIVGMATKFTSCSLSLFFRRFNTDGSVSGGPMYYLEKGLNQRWLGLLFALFALIASFGIGNMVQANSVAEPLLRSLNIPKYATGMVIAFVVWLVIIGGIKRIAKVASFIVPFMAIVYVVSSLVILAFSSEFGENILTK